MFKKNLVTREKARGEVKLTEGISEQEELVTAFTLGEGGKGGGRRGR
jgi:hypothetical protein